MRRRESEELTERPIVKDTREDMQERSGSYSESKSMMKSKHNIKPEGLASEGQIIQKGKESYKSNRYKDGLLAPKKEIIQEKNPDYKNNRYR